LILPSPILKELKFEFTHDKENLITELNLVCNKTQIENCIEIDNINYQIFLNMDVSNSFIAYSSSENIEIEMIMNSKSRKQSIKRILFFERLDNFSDFAYKLLMTPFKIFGFFNSKNKEILIIENYDNNKIPLIKVDFIIKNKNLNLNNSHIQFIPIIGFIRRWLSYIKIILVPIIFSLSVCIQVMIYIFSLYMKRKKINY